MVAPLDREFMRWIYELRLGIEPLAASLAAARATPQQVARGDALNAAGQQAIRTGSIGELIDADMRFHMYLYEASGNGLFVDTMGQLWHHLRRAMREVLQHREYRKTIWTEHAHIQRAIAAHDEAGAAALIRAHLTHAAVNVQVTLPTQAEAVDARP
jgi:DNA-binding GntR family transcriptional regulator